jgi:hypothetical protein
MDHEVKDILVGLSTGMIALNDVVDGIHTIDDQYHDCALYLIACEAERGKRCTTLPYIAT